MKKILIVSLIALSMIAGLFILTGCNNKTEDSNAEKSPVQNTAEYTNAEKSSVQNNAEETDPNKKIANSWMKLPKDVNMFWRVDVKNSSDYSISKIYKRGNDTMHLGESFENGTYITTENDGITNEYYYYHHQEDYIWTSYCYFSNKGWDNWYFKGNYPSSPQNFCFGRPWNILDNYSDNHETVTIEGIGAVDTVIGVDDEGYTYYYSKDLGFNVKIENVVQTWYLASFDTNVSADFPRAIPDTEALDKLKESSNTQTKVEEESQKVYEDKNGELVVYDD